MPSVSVWIDASEVLDDLSDEEIEEELKSRREKAPNASNDEMTRDQVIRAMAEIVRAQNIQTSQPLRDAVWDYAGVIL